MPPKRRDRPDPLGDAKDAINNTTSMNEDDRQQLFAASLLQLSKTRACELTRMCIDVGWKTGVTLAISALSVDDIDENLFLNYIVSCPNFDEKKKVEYLTLFILRNCSVNQARPVEEGDEREYCVFATKSSHDIVWKNTSGAWSFQPGARNLVIHCVQTFINKGVSSVLDVILSKLNKAAYRLALAEAIGSNSKKCYEVLVGKKLKLAAFDLESFAIFLAGNYGRTELLASLLDDATKTATDALKTQGMNEDGFLVSLKSGPSETIFERTARRNHPDCLKLLIEHGLTASHKSQDDLLHYCVKSNFIACAKLLLRACKSSYPVLMEILDELLQRGNDSELCLAVAGRLREFGKEKAVQDYFRTILFSCCKNSWFDGLRILISNGTSVLGTTVGVMKNAAETLNALIVQDDRRCDNIIKHLILFVNFDVTPYFERVVLRTENADLVEFFLGLNDEELIESAKEWIPSVKNETIKKLVEAAKFDPVKVKIEAQEEPNNKNDKNSKKKK